MNFSAFFAHLNNLTHELMISQSVFYMWIRRISPLNGNPSKFPDSQHLQR